MTEINCVSRILRYRTVWSSLKNDFLNSPTARLRNLGPHNCQTQGYSGSQINSDMEILCGRLLMTWPPMMIGVSVMCHCFEANLPYPLVLIRSFFKLLPFPPNSFDWYKNSQWGIEQAGIGPKVMNGQTGVAFCWHSIYLNSGNYFEVTVLPNFGK